MEDLIKEKSIKIKEMKSKVQDVKNRISGKQLPYDKSLPDRMRDLAGVMERGEGVVEIGKHLIGEEVKKIFGREKIDEEKSGRQKKIFETIKDWFGLSKKDK